MSEMTNAPDTASGAPEDVRRRLALALDIDDLVEAARMAQRLRPWFGTVKIGLELFTAAGPDAISTFIDSGMEVFCDLKLHDIPTTVRRASRVLGSLGVSYSTMHGQGGIDMLEAGVDGLREGAESAGLPDPMSETGFDEPLNPALTRHTPGTTQ